MNKAAAWLLLAIVSITSVSLLFSSTANGSDYRVFRDAGHAALGHKLTICHIPHELAVFAPLSLLSFSTGLWTWRILGVGLLIASGLMLCSMYRLPRSYIIAAFAFFPVIYCLCIGQDSLLLLFLLTSSLYLTVKGEPLIAGVVLALALFKPQVPAVVAIAMLVSGHKRFVAGFVAGAAVVYLGCAAVFGMAWPLNWLSITRIAEGFETATKFLSIQGLLSFVGPFSGTIPASTVSLGLLMMRFFDWRKTGDVNIAFGSAVLVGSLCAFHFHMQDASLFLIPLAILTERGLSSASKLALAPFFVFPLVIFLMYRQAGGLLAISSIIWLHSFDRVMIVNTGFALPAPEPETAVAVPNE